MIEKWYRNKVYTTSVSNDYSKLLHPTIEIQ
jgi:hypothetical protein